MALIKSSLLADIRGSIGGTTYSRNRGGSYARNRTVPINPQSISQTRARSDLAFYSVAWSGLTSAQRLAWNQYAETVEALNVLGESITFTGQQMYIRSNTLLQLAGLADVTAAPPSNVQIALVVDSSTTASYDAGDAELTVIFQENFTGTVLGFTSPPQSPGATSLKVPYRFFGAIALSSETLAVMEDAAAARVYVAGQNFAARFVGISSTGLISNEIFVRGTAQA